MILDLSLNDRGWGVFIFENFFQINSTSSGIDRNKLINKEGQYPYLTRTEKNNGYDSFVCKQVDTYSVDNGNVITIGLDTQTIFYQPHAFYTGQNIQVLRCQKLNKKIAHFLIPLIKRQMEKFSWGGNGATLTRLRRSKILLPVDSQGEPDYEFMESYMRQIEMQLLEKYKNYKHLILNEINNLGGG